MTTCNSIVGQGPSSNASPPGLPASIPPLRILYLYLTSGCNLRCRHCWITPKFVNGEPAPGEYLDLELLKKAVCEGLPLGLTGAKLTGGEPMLHPQFIEIVDYLTTIGLQINMETNGTLMDDQTALHLKQNTTLWHISVSLDSPDFEEHDAFRGIPGSFDAAIKGVHALVNVGYRPQIIMSVHKDNLKRINRMVNLAIDLGAGSVKFNPITPTGRGEIMQANDETLTFQDILDLQRFIEMELRPSVDIDLILGLPIAWRSIDEILYQHGDSSCKVLNILGILGTGNTALCGIGQTIPELSFGNLDTCSLQDIWINNPILKDLRHKLQNEEYPGVCGKCIHARTCLTHCVALNFQMYGDLVTPYWICEEAYKQDIFPQERLRER